MRKAISTDFSNGDLLSKFVLSAVGFLVSGAPVAFYGCLEGTYLRELDISFGQELQNRPARVVGNRNANMVQT